MLTPHFWAFAALLLALFFSAGLGIVGCASALRANTAPLRWIEIGQWANAGLLLFASLILFWALGTDNFSFAYVADYTDAFLPQFYALTAFWAGQEGSFLFWAVCIAVLGVLWRLSPSYAQVSPLTRQYAWVFFLAVQAFFLYVLTGPSNPFLRLEPNPGQGNGLNPLLQHPGMIFHPPLLFLGYAGFTIPACLALGAKLSREPVSWLDVSRNWVLISWIFLTAGIILGSWWSYMELGWGGYWAWDPVENASLIPWLSASAFLHTSLIGRRRKALGRSNVFLIGLTLVLCFFGTYLVRSGVIDSLHAFGDGGVGTPLFVLIIVSLLFVGVVAFAGQDKQTRPLSGMVSKQGVMLLAVWLLLAIGLVVLLGTMWPVLSSLWTANPMGLDAGFYNRVCLPLFTFIVLFLLVCPWLGWKGGTRHPKALGATVAAFALALIGLWIVGIQNIWALLAAAGGIGACVSTVLLFIVAPEVRRQRVSWGAFGVHLGLALMFIGVAFSGPYKITTEAVLDKGEAMQVDEYTVTYTAFEQEQTKAMAAYKAVLEVENARGESVGRLVPERRMYRNFQQPFAEAAVIPGLGDELYATLVGFTEQEVVSLKVSVNPLVNWLWIGGTIMCLLPWLCLRRTAKLGERD